MKHTLNCPPNLSSSDLPLDLLASGTGLNLNLFERSEIPQKAYFAQNNFEEIKDKSTKLFSLESATDQLDHFIMFKTNANNEQITQDSIYDVLSFQRGFSEHYDLKSQADYLNNQKSITETFIPEMNTSYENDKIVDINTSQDYETGKSIQSERQSKLIINENEANIQQNLQKRTSTKNVTKNMGKLLFRWIWVNRSKLQLKFKGKNDNWLQFIQQIKQWKKENNITRKFLCQKWQGNEATSKLFRIISAHFFREKCLPCIYESNIEDKMMHIKRISKFLQAVSNSTALDSLN